MGLIGENGSEKTSVINMIMNIIKNILEKLKYFDWII